MKKILSYSLVVFIILAGCGKSDLDIQKEKIQKQANELRIKIDSTQNSIDSARTSLDSLKFRIKKDSEEIDSLIKKANPLKK